MTRGFLTKLGASALALSCLAGLALADSAKQKTTKEPDYQNDPRSGAALNRDAARAFRASGKTLPSVPNPGRFIAVGTVNDPSTDATAQDTQSETSIVHLGSNKLVAAFNDSGSFIGGAQHFTGYAHSADGGATWTDGGTLPASASGDFGDPSLAVDRTTGEVYIAALSGVAGVGMPVFKSTDDGHTWAAPVDGAPGLSGSNTDKEWMTVDNFGGPNNGNIYLCMTDFDATVTIKFFRSTDHGATFGPPTGTTLSIGGQGCFVAVSPDHQVNVFYYRGTGASGQGGDNKLFVRRSTDGGLTFGTEVQVADLATTTTNGNLTLKGGLRSNSFPHAAVNPDPLRPYIYVVYNDDPTPLVTTDQNADVFITFSTDGGSTWSAPTPVDNSAGDQFFPTIGFREEGGRLMVGYYSRVHDSDNLLFHRRSRLARLTSPGAPLFYPSFQLGPNTPVTIGQDPVINATYMGDYDQIAGGPNRLFSTWSDNRTGNAFHARQPDVHSATIVTGLVSADLSVYANPTPGTVFLGDSTTLTIDVSSAGGTSTDVFVNATVDPALKINSATVPGGSCTVISRFVGCSLGGISAGVTKTVTVSLTALQTTGIKVIRAQATTSSVDTSQANNTSIAAVSVNRGNVISETISSGNIAVPIIDLTNSEVPVVLPAGTLVGLTASFRLNHTFDADLDIFLVPPSGTPIELSTDNGSSGDNYGSGANDCSGTPTVLSPTATTSIVSGVVPFAGTFKPEGDMTVPVGGPSGGTWTLRVFDDAGADTGTIGCFNLQILRKP